MEWVYRGHRSAQSPRGMSNTGTTWLTWRSGKWKQEPQGAICSAQTQLPTPQGQPIYPGLPVILDKHGLDHIAKERPRMGRPRVAAGIYFLRQIQQLRQITGRGHGIRLQGFSTVAKRQDSTASTLPRPHPKHPPSDPVFPGERTFADQRHNRESPEARDVQPHLFPVGG